MPTELGTWLRNQRETRGWARPEMARRLIGAGHSKGDRSMPGLESMCHNIYRWERGADKPTERYRLHYCHAFGIQPSRFGPGPHAITSPALPGIPAPAQTTNPDDAPTDLYTLQPATVAYRGMQPFTMDSCTIRREVFMAAHEGSERAEQAEQRGIGDITLEQFRADVTRLAREFSTGEPFQMFLEMRRVRDRMHLALDRRLWPRDTAELYLMIGCLNALMGGAASVLGYQESAEELIRAGLAYATIIDHHPLISWLRLDAAYTAYWSGRPRQSADLAQAGLGYLSAGENAAQLHLYQGLAAAAIGDADTARHAINAAHDAREREHRDDLLEIGGEFTFSRATEHYYAGFVLSELPGGTTDAVTELEHATELYAGGPGQNEYHSRRCQMLAHTDLATVRLRAGALDAGLAALEPVVSLPPNERTAIQSQRLAAVRAELAQPIFRGSAAARDMDERIEEFGRETVGAGLHSLG